MPHLTIEYSKNLESHVDIDQLVDRVHSAAMTSPIVPVAGLRTRAYGRSHYRIADGDPLNTFVALLARLGPGRSDQEKSDFLQLLMETICDASAGTPLSIAYSVEFQEIDARFRLNDNGIRSRMENPPSG